MVKRARALCSSSSVGWPRKTSCQTLLLQRRGIEARHQSSRRVELPAAEGVIVEHRCWCIDENTRCVRVAIYALPRESLNESEGVAESIAGPSKWEGDRWRRFPEHRTPDRKHHCSAEILPIRLFSPSYLHQTFRD